MKLSARNQISGTIVGITPGAVNGSIKVDIGGGNIVTANTRAGLYPFPAANEIW